MKLVFLFGIAFLGFTSSITIPEKIEFEFSEAFIVNTMSKIIVDKLVKEAKIYADPRHVPILPPLNETYKLLDKGVYNLNFSLDIVGNDVNFVGPLELTSDGLVTGLDKLTDNFALQIGLLPTIKWEMTLPKVELNVDYIMDMVLNVGTLHPFVGGGKMSASLEDFSLILNVVLGRNLMSLELSNLNLAVGFKNLALFAENAQLDETIVEWPLQSENLQIYFDTIWGKNDEVKKIISDGIKCTVDSVLKKCTINDLLGGDLGSCLTSVNPDWTCLGYYPPPPTYTDPPTTETSATTESLGINCLPSALLVLLLIAVRFFC